MHKGTPPLINFFLTSKYRVKSELIQLRRANRKEKDHHVTKVRPGFPVLTREFRLHDRQLPTWMLARLPNQEVYKNEPPKLLKFNTVFWTWTCSWYNTNGVTWNDYPFQSLHSWKTTSSQTKTETGRLLRPKWSDVFFWTTKKEPNKLPTWMFWCNLLLAHGVKNGVTNKQSSMWRLA